MPDVKVYIRQENLEAWNAIESKSQWINEKLSPYQIQTEQVSSPVRPDTKITRRPVDIPGLKTAAELDEPECKRHHQPVSSCAHLH